MKILIAYDASRSSQGIPRDLRRSGLPETAEAVVLSVADVLLPPGYDFPDARVPKYILPRVRKTKALVHERIYEALEIARSGAVALRKEFPEWRVHAQSLGGSAVSAVLEKASEWKPDLIVVGSRGRGTFSRLSIGSVAQGVLQQAKCGVRISRADLRIPASRPDRVIVGLDGSPQSRKALKRVLLRYHRASAEIRLVAAVEPSYSDRKTQSVAKRQLEETSKRLRRDGFVVSSLLWKGHPADVLIREAAAWKADCIFVGSRGLGRSRRLLLGSVSAVVAAHARCSVEIVK